MIDAIAFWLGVLAGLTFCAWVVMWCVDPFED